MIADQLDATLRALQTAQERARAANALLAEQAMHLRRIDERLSAPAPPPAPARARTRSAWGEEPPQARGLDVMLSAHLSVALEPAPEHAGATLAVVLQAGGAEVDRTEARDGGGAFAALLEVQVEAGQQLAFTVQTLAKKSGAVAAVGRAACTMADLTASGGDGVALTAGAAGQLRVRARTGLVREPLAGTWPHASRVYEALGAVVREQLHVSPHTFQVPMCFLEGALSQALRAGGGDPVAFAQACEAARAQYARMEAERKHARSVPFKRSVSKADPDLRYLPTNLCLQMLAVHDSPNNDMAVVATMGAPAAHALGFKDGGVLRLRAALEAQTRQLDPSDQSLSAVAAQREAAELRKALAERELVVRSQALAGLVSAVAASLELLVRRQETGRLALLGELGCMLVQLECLLSTQGKELAMLEDVAAAAEWLDGVTLTIREPREGEMPRVGRTLQSECVGFSPEDRSVALLASPELCAALPFRELRVAAVLVSQGVDVRQSVANLRGSARLQERLNGEAAAALERYHDAYVAAAAGRAEPWAQPERLRALTGDLVRLGQSAKRARNEKRLDILTGAADVARALSGARIVFCKSGKDRTAMAATFEQGRVLSSWSGAGGGVDEVVQAMRERGVRRANVYWNTGRPRYAFNKLQRSFLPAAYRPPSFVCGSVPS